jgi:hypothetical protein
MLVTLIKELQDNLLTKEKEIGDLKLRVAALEEKLELVAIEHYNELSKLDDFK